MTNADVIRSMTDDELDAFLARWELQDIDYGITFCDMCNEDRQKGIKGNELGLDCDGCRKHWLLDDAEEVFGLQYMKKRGIL